MTAWSYTSLTCWENCAAQYNYRYNLRLPQLTSGAAARGSIFHSAIEGYLTQTAPLIPALESEIGLLDRLRSSPDLKVELKIGLDSKWNRADWGDAWFRCVVDAMEPGTIWEWKTGKKYDTHRDQRQLYGTAGLAVDDTMEKVQVNGYYLDDRTLEIDVVTKRDAEAIKTDYEMRVDIMQNDKTFAPRPGFYCQWCSYAKSKGGPCRFS